MFDPCQTFNAPPLASRGSPTATYQFPLAFCFVAPVVADKMRHKHNAVHNKMIYNAQTAVPDITRTFFMRPVCPFCPGVLYDPCWSDLYGWARAVPDDDAEAPVSGWGRGLGSIGVVGAIMSMPSPSSGCSCSAGFLFSVAGAGCKSRSWYLPSCCSWFMRLSHRASKKAF